MQLLYKYLQPCLSCLFLLLFAAQSFGQPGLNSPYSRLGLGEISNPNFISIQHMGNLGAAFNDSYHSNFVNPASISFLRSTSFEAGIFAQYSDWTDNTIDNNFHEWSANLTYISLAFPLRNPLNEVLDGKTPNDFWSMGITLQPYSSVGYELLVRTEDPDIGTIDEEFVGDGNTYRLLWTTAWRHRNFSAGLSLGYHFGKININSGTFPRDLSFNYNANTFTDFSINAFVWRLGVQYKYYLDKNAKLEKDALRRSPSITVGLYGNSSHNFTSRSNYAQTRFNSQYGSIDTISLVELDVSSSGTLPAQFGIGFMYDDNVHWKVGLDFAYENWNAYDINVRTKEGEILKDVTRLSVGAEYIPDPQSYNNFFKRVRYRTGFQFGTDPRTVGVNGENQLKRTAVTLGLGLPVVLRQDLSFINIGVELGQFGTDAFLDNQYARFSLGFTLNDNSWFFKRKFN